MCRIRVLNLIRVLKEVNLHKVNQRHLKLSLLTLTVIKKGKKIQGETINILILLTARAVTQEHSPSQ